MDSAPWRPFPLLYRIVILCILSSALLLTAAPWQWHVSKYITQEPRPSKRLGPGGPPPAASETNLTDLTEWLIGSCGAQPALRELYLDAGGGVRGLYSRRALVRGEIIAVLPRACELSADVALRGSSFGRLPPDVTASMNRDYVAMAVFMLASRGGRFEPYYRNLPRSFGNFPRFWPARALALAQGSALLEVAQAELAEWRGWYETLREKLPELRSSSLQEFYQTMTLVQSRVFSIAEANGDDSDSADYSPRLLPLMELRNHNDRASGRTTTLRWSGASREWVLTASADITAEIQLWDDYGKYWARRADDILSIFGFSTDCDALGTLCDYAPAVQLHENMGQEMARRGIDRAVLPRPPGEAGHSRTRFKPRSFLVTYNPWSDAGTLANLLRALRVVFVPAGPTRDRIDAAIRDEGNEDDDEDDEDDANTPGPWKAQAISRDNEASVMSELGRLSEAALKRYRWTEAAVGARLADEKQGSPEYNALRLVLGEQRVLRFWANIAAAAVPLLRTQVQNFSQDGAFAAAAASGPPKARGGLAEYMLGLQRLNIRW